ncbi:hypothetical protein BV20DRAFT_968246 [Pilatotrama ljubarskyi]|nr:hypothetical protein BV20DRAFT_968246 [Pilatotrama ljubarskyi]
MCLGAVARTEELWPKPCTPPSPEGPASGGRMNRPGPRPNGGDRRSRANTVPAPQRLRWSQFRRFFARRPARGTADDPAASRGLAPRAQCEHAALRELSDWENLYQILGGRKRPPPVAEAELEDLWGHKACRVRGQRRRPHASEFPTPRRSESRCCRARR